MYELIISSYRGREEAELISFRYAYTFYYLETVHHQLLFFQELCRDFWGQPISRGSGVHVGLFQLRIIARRIAWIRPTRHRAIEGFQEFINQYPNSDRVGQCNRLIDEMRLKLEMKDYESAKLYYDLQQYQAAYPFF